jgi:hypothetical protein
MKRLHFSNDWLEDAEPDFEIHIELFGVTLFGLYLYPLNRMAGIIILGLGVRWE